MIQLQYNDAVNLFPQYILQTVSIFNCFLCIVLLFFFVTAIVIVNLQWHFDYVDERKYHFPYLILTNFAPFGKFCLDKQH